MGELGIGWPSETGIARRVLREDGRGVEVVDLEGEMVAREA